VLNSLLIKKTEIDIGIKIDEINLLLKTVAKKSIVIPFS
jgi:hypothetical protein